MSTLALAGWPAHGRTLFPGVLASGVVAAAATSCRSTTARR